MKHRGLIILTFFFGFGLIVVGLAMMVGHADRATHGGVSSASYCAAKGGVILDLRGPSMCIKREMVIPL